jgi:hypothetical protein
MATPFSPSVNIVRDATQQLLYIPTQNAQTTFGQIVDNYLSGVHCFNIVGAYGTGKSAFLWAFQQTLNKQKEYFHTEVGFKGIKNFRFVHFVGQYASLKQTLAKHFLGELAENISSKGVINALDQEYQLLSKKHLALVLVVDEFGKFLEYAAKENPEDELYFIQELAEYINDANKDILLITTVHQDISSYAVGLSRTQRQEWEKVKGRLKELTFNEPVEQLLHLAAQQLTLGQQDAASPEVSQQLFDAIEAAHVFPLRDYGTVEVQQQLWPLDLLSAGVLVQSLQRYGQNERSLFSFLRSNDYLGIEQHTRGRYYSMSQVYDYLSYHFYSLLTSRYNPNFFQWGILKNTLEQLEKHFDDEVELNDARQIVKTIGLLSIFSPAGAEISPEFLEAYSQLSLGLTTAKTALQTLQQHKLIRYQKYKNNFILFEGTDLDIELAIDEAGSLVEQVTDVATRLRKFFSFPYIAAKQVSYEIGTPRVFEVRLADDVQLDAPQGEVDGFVNLIFSDTITLDKLRQTVGNRRDAVLYGIYRKSSEIKRLIREIDKVRKVREENPNDKVAVRELDGIYNHQVALLNHYVLDSMYEADGNITWFFNGDAEVKFSNRRSFNRCLSAIAREVYGATPAYRSELVNRTKLSTPILTARKSFIRALFDKWQYPDLDFPAKNFPPEKTIYLSLLQDTGIHRRFNGEYALMPPTAPTFQLLWTACDNFLQQSQTGKLKILELMELLQAKPFKLKQGLIDFWVPVFLFIRRHEFALYGEEGKYIPDLNADVVDLFTKSPALYTVKAFELLPEKLALFNEYRELLQLGAAERLSNKTFIESIKPFLTFYRQLPEYAQRTRNLPASAIRLRESIATSKDPQAAFFETFPGALGFNLLELQNDTATRERYVETLQHNISLIRQAYSALLLRMEQAISSHILGRSADFEQYQLALRERFRSLEPHQLPKELVVFRERIMSKLDDREAWLNSMANALLSKSLKDFDDNDERIFQDRFKQRIHELDNLCELTKTVIDPEAEDIMRVGISTFGTKERARVIRRSKQTTAAETELMNEIRNRLGDDKPRSLAILARLLQEYL